MQDRLDPRLKKLLVRLPLSAVLAILLWFAILDHPWGGLVTRASEWWIRAAERTKVTRLAFDDGLVVVRAVRPLDPVGDPGVLGGADHREPRPPPRAPVRHAAGPQGLRLPGPRRGGARRAPRDAGPPPLLHRPDALRASARCLERRLLAPLAAGGRGDGALLLRHHREVRRAVRLLGRSRSGSGKRTRPQSRTPPPRRGGAGRQKG